MTTITITEVGTIGTKDIFDGIDGVGIFGQPGTSLIGQRFTVIFTGSDCNCSGIGASNPVQDATLTINGITYSFGHGAYGDMFNSIQQVNEADPFTFITTSPGPSTGTGEFRILGAGHSITSGFFIGESLSNSLNVPGPIAGSGLPALIALAVILLRWRRA